MNNISIHAPHAGSDDEYDQHRSLWLSFQSTLPMRGATRRHARVVGAYPDFNPRSPCGERLPVVISGWYGVLISIHAPHAGSDPDTSEDVMADGIFQSTLPMRGATLHVGRCCSAQEISIHAPHAGSDTHYKREHRDA